MGWDIQLIKYTVKCFTLLTFWPSHAEMFLIQTFVPSHPLLLHPGPPCGRCNSFAFSLPWLKYKNASYLCQYFRHYWKIIMIKYNYCGGKIMCFSKIFKHLSVTTLLCLQLYQKLVIKLYIPIGINKSFLRTMVHRHQMKSSASDPSGCK